MEKYKRNENYNKTFLLTCLSSVELRPVTRQMQTVVSQKPIRCPRGGRGEKMIFMHEVTRRAENVGDGWTERAREKGGPGKNCRNSGHRASIKC